MMEGNDQQKATVQLAVIETKVDTLVSQFEKMDQKLNQSYLTKDEAALLQANITNLRQEFVPFKRMVMNILGFLGISIGGLILTAILRLVIK
jgi:hypothetical protein